jgi:hypothetical protein
MKGLQGLSGGSRQHELPSWVLDEAGAGVEPFSSDRPGHVLGRTRSMTPGALQEQDGPAQPGALTRRMMGDAPRRIGALTCRSR